MTSDVFDMLFIIILFAIVIPLGLPKAIKMYQRQSHLVEELKEDKNSQRFSGFGTAEEVNFDNTFNVYEVALMSQLQDANNPSHPDLVYVTGDPGTTAYSFRVNNDYTDKLKEIGILVWGVVMKNWFIEADGSSDALYNVPRYTIQHGFTDTGNFWKIIQDDGSDSNGSIIDESALP